MTWQAAYHRTRQAALSPLTRVAFLVLVFAAAAAVLGAERHQILVALSRIGAGELAAAFAFVLLNLVFAATSWRSVLLDLGVTIPLRSAAHIYYLGQAGKYLPGGIWNFVAVAELGHDTGLPRRQTVAGFMIALLIGIATGALVAIILLPLANQPLFGRYWWAVLAAPAAVAVLHPAVLGKLLALARADTLRTLSLGGSAAAAGWAVAGWLMVGFQLWILAGAVGAPLTLATLALVTGGYALAWVAGFIVMVAPAGLGPREAVLTVVLATVVQPGEAFLVALLSRLLVTVADLAAAAAVVLVNRRLAST